MTENYEISLATPDDIPGILALQEPNLPENGGTLSVRQPTEFFRLAIGEKSLMVCRRDGTVVGYVLGTSLTTKAHIPIIQAMLRAFPALPNCYLYGPVCVAQSERGNGVAGALFQALQAHMNDRPAMTFIRADNAASRQAHRKMGMRELGGFHNEGIDFIALGYPA
jgi:predicted N-acetyltransferase YhbS